MFMWKKLLILAVMLAVSVSFANAFFWGSSEQEQPKQQLYAYPFPSIYQQRYIQQQQDQPSAAHNVEQVQQVQQVPQGQGSGPIPAIPIQVPLHAQFSPISNLHNVQLVPCLCPVSPNVEYERIQEQIQ